MAEKTLEKTFDGNLTIKSMLELIRYDIPVLLLGKSSIGKSYTLIDITKKWNIPNSLLYIGSEKSENIEGVPKLVERGKDKEILEYLQPYWFPDAKLITRCVKNGKKIFEEYEKLVIGDFDYSFTSFNNILNALSYLKWGNENMTVENGKSFFEMKVILEYRPEQEPYIDNQGKPIKTALINKKLKLIKDVDLDLAKKGGKLEDEQVQGNVILDEYIRDDLRDFCLYITTILGYGNFWLILDEIDKVEEHDKDKFAPLLHIVREKTLKNFRMTEINNGEGLGVPLKALTTGIDGYKKSMDILNKNLQAGERVLDTRVMAIANKTHNIEEALFRRFVQLIAEEVMIWRPEEIGQEKSIIASCLESTTKEMKVLEIESAELAIRHDQTDDDQLVQLISEVNLQWKYTFLPKIMNEIDFSGNFFVQNIIANLVKDGKTSYIANKQHTAFYKLLHDNFISDFDGITFDLPDSIFTCLTDKLVLKDGYDQVEKIEDAERKKMEEKVENLDPKEVAEEYVLEWRTAYENKIFGNKPNKLYELDKWTKDIVNALDVAGMEVRMFLIPLSVSCFYSEMAKDPTLQTDNITAQAVTFQKFFEKNVDDIIRYNSIISIDATEEAFTGVPSEIKQDFKKWNEDDKISQWNNSLFGSVNRKHRAGDGTYGARRNISDKYVIENVPQFFNALFEKDQDGKYVRSKDEKNHLMKLFIKFNDFIKQNKIAKANIATILPKDSADILIKNNII